MLVLTLKENEAVAIGESIRVMVVKVKAGKQVRLGIEAPPGVLVLRVEDKPPGSSNSPVNEGCKGAAKRKRPG